MEFKVGDIVTHFREKKLIGKIYEETTMPFTENKVIGYVVNWFNPPHSGTYQGPFSTGMLEKVADPNNILKEIL